MAAATEVVTLVLFNSLKVLPEVRALSHSGSFSIVKWWWLTPIERFLGPRHSINLPNHLCGKPITISRNRWRSWATCPMSHRKCEGWDLNPGSGSHTHMLSQDPKLSLEWEEHKLWNSWVWILIPAQSLAGCVSPFLSHTWRINSSYLPEDERK